MRLILTVSTCALAFCAVLPATAQTTAGQKPTPDGAQYFCPGSNDKATAAALTAYNAAVAGSDAAATASARAAAAAAVKTDADRCVLGQIDLNAATKTGNDAEVAAKAEALANNPVANKAMIGPMLLDAGKMYYDAKNYAAAGKLFERVATSSPNDAEALMLLAEARSKSGRAAEAPALAMKAIALDKAAGRKVAENNYRQALAIALEAKSATAADVAGEWVSAYPTTENWRTALQVLAQSNAYADADMMDIYRLKAATKAFSSSGDVANYAFVASKLGYPGEAKAAIENGIASGTVQSSNTEIANMLKVARGKVAGDKATLATDTAKALSSGNTKSAMAYGDANFGYGDYAKAADVYRKVAGMAGADVPTANLRLGMSLAMSGDKAHARAALTSVTGSKAPIAKYWLAYVNSKA